MRLEEGLWAEAASLERQGFSVVLERDVALFGGGQAILVDGDVLVGGSDSSKGRVRRRLLTGVPEHVGYRDLLGG